MQTVSLSGMITMLASLRLKSHISAMHRCLLLRPAQAVKVSNHSIAHVSLLKTVSEMPDTGTALLFAQQFLGVCRYRGPIAVGELMHFFDATHESINDPARVSTLECASSSRPTRRNETEVATPLVSPATLTAGTQHEDARQSQVRALGASKCCVLHAGCLCHCCKHLTATLHTKVTLNHLLPISCTLLQADIHLILKSVDGTQMHFELSPATLLREVLFRYACKTLQPLDTLRFIFKGKQIDGSLTAQQYEIEDQDVIHVVLRLIGD